MVAINYYAHSSHFTQARILTQSNRLAGGIHSAFRGVKRFFALPAGHRRRGGDLLGPTHGLPELLAGAAVVGLHLWKKNTLLSIAVGTALYMVLVQAVFV